MKIKCEILATFRNNPYLCTVKCMFDYPGRIPRGASLIDNALGARHHDTTPFLKPSPQGMVFLSLICFLKHMEECFSNCHMAPNSPFFNVVIWSRSFGHFRFRKRGHCSLYINRIFIYSGEFWQSVFDFDQMTLTKWPRQYTLNLLWENYFFLVKYSWTAMKMLYLCNVKWERWRHRPLRIKIASIKSRNCAH